MNEKAAQAPTVVYVSASQYSGSTLASFLLNTHSAMATLGHSTGWPFGEHEAFYCSCGELLEQCPFYREISRSFAENHLPFDIRNFGTEYRLARHDRLNRYLTASLPAFESSALEKLRDTIVEWIPGVANRLAQQDKANWTLINAALINSGASIYVDNSHDPYRLRKLTRIEGLELKNIHLVRDPRGVVLSCMKNANWSASLAVHLWQRRQRDIVRIGAELSNPSLRIYYEDLCRETDRILALIHQFAGAAPQPFPGSFDSAEHHILGNAMRLRDNQIRFEERWRRELQAPDLDTVNASLIRFADSAPEHPVTEIIRHYLSDS